MNKLIVDLGNCYGIKSLKTAFDFSQGKVHAIYAPNGSMKTSFANTFNDIVESRETKDNIHPERFCRRVITDENNVNIPKNSILVIPPYDEFFKTKEEKVSTLLVDNELRKEYESIYLEINNSKEILLKALKEQSGSKKNLEEEISLTFTKSHNEFYKALFRMKDEIEKQEDTPFSEIQYDIIFDEKVEQFLENKDVKKEIKNYIKKYNELLDSSKFFKKGTFDYYNGSEIASNLAKNGFFDAKHSINLNAEEKIEITSQDQLEKLINEEREKITSDYDLKKIFANIDKLITKNLNTREFKAYLGEHEELLPMLDNLGKFKEEIWKSYIKVHRNLFNDLITKYSDAERRKNEIEDEAAKQRTQWEAVIDIFNERFFVPFKLIAKNKIPVILGQDSALNLEFSFDEPGEKPVPIERTDLMKVLSTGEKKALYILNIIFEIEARIKANQETLFIVDDIADSFDYRNKYAIIQYLQDINKESFFYQIVLTHNFDFFRTISSRFVKYSNCRIAHRDNKGISLEQACGIKNVFINDWKPNFFLDEKKRIASIPFLRNLIEYLRGDQDGDFLKLTSLLHWKNDSDSITQDDLDIIFNCLFGTEGKTIDGQKSMIDQILSMAENCLKDDMSINFENKIVLSIAIRIIAEKYMVVKINNQSFIDNISSNQTPKLLEKYSELFSEDDEQIKIIRRVILMTPENIHLNSFMYEPILDMSDEHLKKLYQDVLTLK